MTRRRFLQNLAGGAAGIGLGLPRIARGNTCGTGIWGEITCDEIWAGETPATKLLDIHIAGGMAPWESFYFRPDGGRTRGFDADVEALMRSSDAAHCGVDANNPTFNHPILTDELGGLDLTSLAAYETEAFRIGVDAANKPVHLGPYALPLRLHRKMWDHTRVVVLAHDLSPHEAAIPFAVTGRRLGRPNFCCLGAPISRAERQLTGGGHVLPYSYALVSPFASNFPAFGAFIAEGGHGGANKPLLLKPGPGFAPFVNRLQRSNVNADDIDLARAWYRAQYQRWLTHSGVTTRTPAFDDYLAATDALVQNTELHSLLEGAPPPIADSAPCTGNAPTANSGITRTSLDLAAHLLTRTGDEATRYVGLVDEGLEHTGLMEAYDVHNTGAVSRTSRNIWNLLAGLTGVVNDYDEEDPNKIDLEKTMIVLGTEFGRTPFRSAFNAPSPSSTGRDHWPRGYAVMLIGGPIPGRGVAGSLSDGTGVDAGLAETFYNPTDIRAACLIAQNIYPFEGDLYQVGRITPALQGTDPLTSHDVTMVNLRKDILGVT